MHNIGTIAVKVILGATVLVAAWVALLSMSTGMARADTVDWDALAQCESGGNWSTNTGNGFYGGLQFTQATWNAHGGSGAPHRASRSEQIRVAQNVLRSQGPAAWPTCSRATTFAGPATAPPVTRPAGGAVQYLQNTVSEIASLLRGLTP